MWTPKYLSPQTEEDFDLFPPFAKRSKEVNRRCEESVLPEQPQYEPFWRPDVPLSCEESFRYEPFLDPGLYFSSSAGMERQTKTCDDFPFHLHDFKSIMVSRQNRVSAGLTHEKLPHPSQLMGRRNRSQGLQKQAANVLKHIGELRTRQCHINALKGDKWCGATALFSPEESGSPTEAGNEQLLGLTAGISFSTLLMDNPDVTMTNPFEASSSMTHHQKFLFRGYEQFLDLAPGRNPMMAFVAGTAHRSLLMADDATVNPAGSDVFPRSVDEESHFYKTFSSFK